MRTILFQMRTSTILSCVFAGLSCFSGPIAVDAQFTTSCSSWAPESFDPTTVDAAGSCLHGQKAADWPVHLSPHCPIAADGSSYACQCMTQADANGGDVAFAEMLRKQRQKKRLRKAGWAFFGLMLVFGGLLGSGDGDNEAGAGGIPLGTLLFIIFLACGYTNRNDYNPELTPYFVGCGVQAQSLGAYSLSISNWAPSVNTGAELSPPSPSPPPPAALAAACGGCLEGTAGGCKQPNGLGICVPFTPGTMDCPETFAACSNVEEQEQEADIKGNAGETVVVAEEDAGESVEPSTPIAPTTATKNGLSGGAIAGIVIGSLFGVGCIVIGSIVGKNCYYERKSEQRDHRIDAFLQSFNSPSGMVSEI